MKVEEVQGRRAKVDFEASKIAKGEVRSVVIYKMKVMRMTSVLPSLFPSDPPPPVPF